MDRYTLNFSNDASAIRLNLSKLQPSLSFWSLFSMNYYFLIHFFFLHLGPLFIMSKR